MPFPIHRMRRLRRNERLRSLVRETRLTPESMIYPIFVCPGTNVRNEIGSMPGQYNLSVDNAVKIARDAEKAGIAGILLFGIPKEKDELGSDCYSEEGIVQEALRAIRENVRDLLLITDVCLCEYTAHGHCGLIRQGDVENDPTLNLLAESAVSHVPGSRRYCRAVGHDGWPRSGHPPQARSGRLRGHTDHGLLR